MNQYGEIDGNNTAMFKLQKIEITTFVLVLVKK